jgi:hypothetical protein
MPKKVPYLYEEQIERDVAALLAEFAQARSVVIAPPIPIEDIVEKHLKLGIEFDDMHRLLNYPRSGLDPDILGAIWFDDRRIVIDESLDPEENPSKEGRYRFTLAHEGGGHWRLHRHLFAKDPAQVSLFNEPAPPSVVCRSSQAKEPVEWQAEFYASCLLMPRKLVMAAWDEMFPDRKLGSWTSVPLCDHASRCRQFGHPAGAGPYAAWLRLVSLCGTDENDLPTLTMVWLQRPWLGRHYLAGARSDRRRRARSAPVSGSR